MPAYRSLRVQLPDRPGALSGISTAFAVHGVDIVQLDVVSHEGAIAVDDMLVSANSVDDIGAAIASFQPDIVVRAFDDRGGDPAVALGQGLLSVASAPSMAAAREAAAAGALHVTRSDAAVLLRLSPDGSLVELTSLGLPAIAPGEPFAGRYAARRATAIAFPVADGWAPPAVQHALGSAWVAIAPCGPLDLLVVARRLNIAFFRGELERFAVYARAVGAIRTGHGDAAAYADTPADVESALPARAITLDEGLAV